MHVQGKHTCLLSCFVATHEQDRASFVIQEGRREEGGGRVICQATNHANNLLLLLCEGSWIGESEKWNIMFRNLETTMRGLEKFSWSSVWTYQTNMYADNFTHLCHDFYFASLQIWWQNRAAIECFFPIRLLLFLCCNEHEAKRGGRIIEA